MTGIELITIEQLLVGFGAAFAALGGIAGLGLAGGAIGERVTRRRLERRARARGLRAPARPGSRSVA